MIGVITGDIINSRASGRTEEWLNPLKDCLTMYGKTPKDWEIYRGDSFQIRVNTDKVIKAAVHIKAALRSIKDLDARMAIGIGEISYDAPNVTESNGTAFIYSGELFEELDKEKRNLGVRTSSEGFNHHTNITFALALIIMDDWSPGAAQMVNEQLKNETVSQTQLANTIGKTQVAVSKGLKRAHYTEIKNYIDLITDQINENQLK